MWPLGARPSHDFGRFVVDDMFGGTFFHVVLGTLVGLGAGVLSAAIVGGVKWLHGRPDARGHAGSQTFD